MTVCPSVGNEKPLSCNCGMHVPSLHLHIFLHTLLVTRMLILTWILLWVSRLLHSWSRNFLLFMQNPSTLLFRWYLNIVLNWPTSLLHFHDENFIHYLLRNSRLCIGRLTSFCSSSISFHCRVPMVPWCYSPEVRGKDCGFVSITLYRALNANTMTDSYPWPRIDDLLSRLGGCKVFSKLDLRDGYHQLEVHE